MEDGGLVWRFWNGENGLFGCEGDLANDTTAALNCPFSRLHDMKAISVVVAEERLLWMIIFLFGQTFCEVVYKLYNSMDNPIALSHVHRIDSRGLSRHTAHDLIQSTIYSFLLYLGVELLASWTQIQFAKCPCTWMTKYSFPPGFFCSRM